jgi:hypothetical protein
MLNAKIQYTLIHQSVLHRQFISFSSWFYFYPMLQSLIECRTNFRGFSLGFETNSGILAALIILKLDKKEHAMLLRSNFNNSNRL